MLYGCPHLINLTIVEKDEIFFACDMHLGSDLLESAQTREKYFVNWLDTIKDEAKALYLLGDIFGLNTKKLFHEDLLVSWVKWPKRHDFL